MGGESRVQEAAGGSRLAWDGGLVGEDEGDGEKVMFPSPTFFSPSEMQRSGLTHNGGGA